MALYVIGVPGANNCCILNETNIFREATVAYHWKKKASDNLCQFGTGLRGMVSIFIAN
jgi:hypothetical protein